jgi:hypothetical protein
MSGWRKYRAEPTGISQRWRIRDSFSMEWMPRSERHFITTSFTPS